MVHRKADKRSSIDSQKTKASPDSIRRPLAARIVTIILIFISAMILVLVVNLLIALVAFTNIPSVDTNSGTLSGADESSEITEISLENLTDLPMSPKRIDFQPVIDHWAASTGGNKSVLVYDLDLNEIVGIYNPNKSYGTASLYKLFVVYEGYRRVQAGEWDKDAKAGSTGNTISKCLDLAIRQSNSPCAETLWAMIGHNTLDEIIKNDFNITDSNISNLKSNVTDIYKILKIFYEHRDITDEFLIAQMKDSFLNQPVTTYDWRRGLPSGFSKATDVYNKVGWDYDADKKRWNIYHDASIVEFPDLNRRFIVVVMTNYVSNQSIRNLGTEIEKLVRAE